MHIIELFFVAVGLSMDAFAVSVCMGLSMKEATPKKCLTAGLYFGGFQAAMPLIGYFLGARFAAHIVAYDHWIAFLLLLFIGGKMIAESRKGADCPEEEASLSVFAMLPLAVATSIDALAVGVSFAFLNVQIAPAVLCIGVITFLLSAIGVKIGSVFGVRFKSKAEILGGVILILMGGKILLEHLGVF
ncbi:manganese efflux pump MntP family protein [Oscillospiraceae bacterium OttesenSCG-928-G22]|nr:manganese efflux pump MntP family protein [Oscillospiraceae bacterium OttesenSCG-928-G22]